jgi:phosphatidate cytidylyltransferase
MFELRRLPFRAQGYFFVGLYSIISFLSVYWLSKEVYLLFFLFCIVWSSDIGAYCAGKFFGGPKVLPKVSPNKTWAGVFGACILTLFVTRLFVDYYLIPNEIRVAPVNFQILDTDVLVLSLIFSLLSQIGDFLQSYIKRQLGIKDTGSLIPGHGGLFDRLDGLMFVAPIFALFIYYL